MKLTDKLETNDLIELKAKLLYYANETGLPKKVRDEACHDIMAGYIHDIEFNEKEETFRFLYRKNYWLYLDKP